MLQRRLAVGFVHKLAGFLSDLTREELERVLPIASAYGLVLASLYLLKPARNALFLSQIGVDKLPYALLMVALVGAAAALVYGRYARTQRTDRLINVTFGVMMVMLVGFRLILPTTWGWVYYVFFIWVALYGVLTTSLIWLLANAVFTTREARRVFGFIGTGGIAGAILGGLFTGWVVDRLGTENLLLVCVLFLSASLALLRLTPAAGEAAENRRGRRRRSDESPGLGAVLNADLIRTLALTTGLIATVAVIVDIQFNEMVDRAFDNQDAKTAFFGSFFAYLSGVSFLIQLFATPWLLRTVGVGVSIMVLPVAMGLGSAALFALPGLMAAVLAKGADGGFRHSIHKSASEVIFLPVPESTKKTAKLFLDTTVDTTATGLGALVVVLLTGPIGLDSRYVSLVAVGLIMIAVAIAPSMRRAYVDAFRQALDRRTIDISALTTSLSEAAVLNALLPALKSSHPRQVLYALSLLTSAKSPAIGKAVEPLLDHTSADVRHKALEVLHAQGFRVDTEVLEPMLRDESDEVRRAAMRSLSQTEGIDTTKFLQTQLDGDDDVRRAAALGCIARASNEVAEQLLTTDRVTALLERVDTDERLRAELAATVAVHPDPNLAPRLLEGLDAETLAIQRAAIEGMGRSRDPRHIDFLIHKLTDSRLRRDARRSLALYGDRIVPTVLFELDNLDRSPRQHEALARVLEDVGTQAATDALLAHIQAADPILRRGILRALSRLRQSNPDLVFTKDVVHRAIMADAERAYDLARATAGFAADRPGSGSGDPRGERPGDRLLHRALDEKHKQTIEHLFLQLGLRHSPRDMTVAYQGVVSAKKPIRASALEFLDNVIEAKLKPLILPLLDPPPRGIARVASDLFPKPLDRRTDTLAYLLRGTDPWLKACAVYCVHADDPDPLPGLVRGLTEDRDPVVRETAETTVDLLC